MTDQEIRIGMAQACPNWGLGCLFDPLEDLNAMHHVEPECGDMVCYLKTLWHVCNGRPINLNDDSDCLTNYLLNVIRATARQRAEAFLRTKRAKSLPVNLRQLTGMTFEAQSFANTETAANALAQAKEWL